MKLDLKQDLKHFYQPSAKEIVTVDVPSFSFLMIDGAGNPNTAPEYSQAVEALYSAAYTLKFAIKKSELEIDYPVMPLEGLWWAADPDSFSLGRKDDWFWTMMILQPECVTQARVDQALEQVRRKKDVPALSKLRFESFHEGLAAQIMYIGPYAAEGPTIARLHQFIADNGCGLTGKHHEIYLGDPRKSAPDKLKTIIRQPMAHQTKTSTEC
jgi:hypothetical protein